MRDGNKLPCKISVEMCRGRGRDGRHDAERKGNGVSSGIWWRLSGIQCGILFLVSGYVMLNGFRAFGVSSGFKMGIVERGRNPPEKWYCFLG